jgi:hypothetical protein
MQVNICSLPEPDEPEPNKTALGGMHAMNKRRLHVHDMQPSFL